MHPNCAVELPRHGARCAGGCVLSVPDCRKAATVARQYTKSLQRSLRCGIGGVEKTGSGSALSHVAPCASEGAGDVIHSITALPARPCARMASLTKPPGITDGGELAAPADARPHFPPAAARQDPAGPILPEPKA